MMEQLQMFDTRPNDGYLCDMCRRLVWRGTYCACIAPRMDGRGFEGAGNRKPMGASCACFEQRGHTMSYGSVI